jgi:hypothetical protein
MMTTSEKTTQESTTWVHPIWYPHYELAPIGWQLFALDYAQSYWAAPLLLLGTYDTRLLAQPLCHKEGPLYTYLVLSCALAVSTELTLALLSVYFPSAPHRALPAAQVAKLQLAKLQLLSRCYDKLIDMCLFEVGPYTLCLIVKTDNGQGLECQRGSDASSR